MPVLSQQPQCFCRAGPEETQITCKEGVIRALSFDVRQHRLQRGEIAMHVRKYRDLHIVSPYYDTRLRR